MLRNLLVRTDALLWHLLCFVDRASRYNSGKWPTWRTVLFSYMFISILYMFRATSCSSLGESIASIHLLVYVTRCKWPSSMHVRKGLRSLPDLHTRRSLTQSDIYQKMYRCNWFSWWWARGCSKHVEDWNKHIRKENCASSWSLTRTGVVTLCYICLNSTISTEGFDSIHL
jgi:hypothetical protein